MQTDLSLTLISNTSYLQCLTEWLPPLSMPVISFPKRIAVSMESVGQIKCDHAYEAFNYEIAVKSTSLEIL